MKLAGEILFYLVIIVLLAAAFSPRLRAYVLQNRTIAALERRLRGVKGGYALAVVLCLAAGLFVRCYRFGVVPQGLNQDGTMAGVEAYCLMMDGVDQHGTSWPVYFEAWGYSQMSTLYSWLLIPFIRVLGLSRFSLRLPMLLVSLASLPVLWDFARRVAGKRFALLVLFIAVINPWHAYQSRWAIDCNLLPHLMLLGVYLLFLGRQSRPALYASMAVFGVAVYAYALSLFSIPVLLVGAAVFYLARKKVRPADVVICALIFLAVSWPFLLTMAINALGLETVTLGKMTMPLFEESRRTNDMAFFAVRPYYTAVKNFFAFLSTFLFDLRSDMEWFDWAQTMYRFMPPVIVCGLYWMWRDRRALALSESQDDARDGLMLILLWLGAAAVCGVIVGGVVNRCNAVFYPLILICAYGLWQMGKRLRLASAVVAVMLSAAFVCFGWVILTDERCNTYGGAWFQYGALDALEMVRDSDADHIYVTTKNSGQGRLVMRGQLMFAHEIDYSMLTDQRELTDSHGQTTGRYYSDRYIFQNFTDFVPDPQENAVYVIGIGEKSRFDESLFTIVEVGVHAVVFPKNADL